jgi:hypothetical protein
MVFSWSYAVGLEVVLETGHPRVELRLLGWQDWVAQALISTRDSGRRFCASSGRVPGSGAVHDSGFRTRLDPLADCWTSRTSAVGHLELNFYPIRSLAGKAEVRLHRMTETILPLFEAHLPTHLRSKCDPIHQLAAMIVMAPAVALETSPPFLGALSALGSRMVLQLLEDS